jgi:hypothetical protein
MEKPATNRSIGLARRARPFEDVADPDPTPAAVTNDRYPGTSGRTQGEANATIPAAKARSGAHQAVRSNSLIEILV